MTGQRSPNYPAISLEEAVRAAAELYKSEKRTVVTPEVAAQAMGYGSLNGRARTKLSALKKYGLIEDVRGGLRVADRVTRLILNPHGSSEATLALQEAALEPDIFREIWGTHREASDRALINHLVFERRFAEVGARQFIKAFRSTIEFAGLRSEPLAADNARSVSSEPDDTEGPVESGPVLRSQVSRPGAVFRWPLGPEVTAELSFVGGPVTERHFELLQQYIELAKAAMG
jgi:hypothetical protein